MDISLTYYMEADLGRQLSLQITEINKSIEHPCNYFNRIY